MEKTVKTGQIVVIVITFILAAITIGFGYFLRAYAEARSDDPIEYPEGYVQNDIFTQQNTTYVESSTFTNISYLGEDGYLIDVLSANSAVLGDGNGIAYIINSDNMSYQYTTHGEGGWETLSGRIANELPYVVYSSPDLSASIVTVLYAESGYINGYLCDYAVLDVTCANATSTYDLYMVGYAIYENGNFYFEGVTYGALDEEMLVTLRDLAYEDYFTFRFVQPETTESSEEETSEDETSEETEEETETEEESSEDELSGVFDSEVETEED